MTKRGLNVVRLDAATAAEWRRESQATYPRLGCNLEHPDVYRKVMGLLGASGAPR
jgi:hypothetical protein